MILKYKDDLAPHLAELERLLSFPSLTSGQRDRIESALAAMRAGAKGERDAAYHIDFPRKNGKNSVVIHDLRLDHGGRVAQIDHLILTRALDCHVIESKGFGNEVRILANGEWETQTRYGWRGIPSPVEQNRRHIEVLKSFVGDSDILPKRLGLALPIEFHNWVLVSPMCQLRRTGKDWDQVVKMDMFERRLEKFADDTTVLGVVTALSKFVSLETIMEIGQRLLAAHRPASFNFAATFGIENSQGDQRFAPPEVKDAPKCRTCGCALEQRVINFCRINAKRFEGKLLCQACQKTPVKVSCDDCGVDLPEKVVMFCQLNTKRFGGRLVCRMCQKAAPVVA